MNRSHSSAWAAQLGVDADELATMNDQDLLDTVDSQAAIESMFMRVRIPDDEEIVEDQQCNKSQLPPGYRVERKLGSGGFGEVLLAIDERLGRQVAIKRLRADRWAMTHDSDELLHEARTVAKLTHPGIVTLHEIKQHRDQWHLVSEFVAGGTLADRADSLDETQIAQVGAQIARALAYAHQQSVIHRDLKLSNVLMTDEGQTRLTDFGLAVNENYQSMLSSHAVGTLRYIAPEQLPGGESFIDGRVDIWALGVILYRLLTGHFPFGNADIARAELFREIRERSPKPPAQYKPTISPMLSRICLRCLEKKPADRFDSAEEVAVALTSFADTKTTEGPSRSKAIFAAVTLTAACVATFALWPPAARMFRPQPDSARAADPPVAEAGAATTGLAANAATPIPNRIETFQLRHYRYDDDQSGEQLGLLGRDTDHALFGDELRVEATFARNAHVCLLEVTPAGDINVHYPEKANEDEQRSTFSYPEDAYSTLVLNDRPGAGVFAVIVSDAAIEQAGLTQSSLLADDIESWQEQELTGVWRFTHDQVDQGFFLRERSQVKSRPTAPPMFQRLCERLIAAVPSANVAAIAFPIRTE